MNSIEDRLDTLESVVDEQQTQIESHKETIAAQQATIDAQRERLEAVENDGGVSMPISRRGALTAGGALGLLGLGAGTASASTPSGQVGTASQPLQDLHSRTVNFAEGNGGFTKIESNQTGEFLEFTLGVYPNDTALRLEKQGTTFGDFPNVIGGKNNGAFKEEANINGAFIGGGYLNSVSEDFGAIGGGSHNTTNGEYATVPGGKDNEAAGNYSFAVGREAKANHDGAFIVGDSNAANAITSTGPNQARFQMDVGAAAFKLLTQRGDPTTDELSAGEGMIYITDGVDTGSPGDLVYGYDADGAGVETAIIVTNPDSGGV